MLPYTLYCVYDDCLNNVPDGGCYRIYDDGVNRVYNGVLHVYMYMLMVLTVNTMEWCLSLGI